MKPTVLQAYEKARRVIDSMTITTICPVRNYITIFSKMFVYGTTAKNSEKNRFYREQLLRQFDIKLNEICSKSKKT